MLKSFKSRISAMFFLVTVLVSVFFFTTLYLRAVENETERLRHYLKNSAALGAAFLDGDEVLKVPLQEGCEKSLIRQDLTEKLRRIVKIDPRLDDAYVMVPSGTENIFRFVANANLEESPVACGEDYDVSRFPQMANALKAPDADTEITRDKWGKWLSGYAPVHDFQGNAIGILGLDIAAETVRDLQRVFLSRFFLVMAIAFVLAFLVGALSSQWLTRPIDQIIRGMERVSDGDLNYFLKTIPEVEFNRIVTIFNRMTDSLKTLMARHEKAVRENERVARELEIAADLQKNALPAGAPDVPGLDIAATSIPAKEVGGDYFDFLTLEAGKTGFVIADAAGKGFPGTLYMTNSRSIFRVISSEERAPRLALARTNDFISRDASSVKGLFITFLYSIYDERTKEFTCANAGHYLPIIYSARNKKFRTLSASGLPLGIFPDQDYQEETVRLAPDDVVVMYTDGVIEAANARKDMFGLSRLMKLVEESASGGASAILGKIETAMRAFVGTEPAFDDMTLLVFKVR
jgi:serine phosphatase RsbU (regulator of sigma subunit)